MSEYKIGSISDLISKNANSKKSFIPKKKVAKIKNSTESKKGASSKNKKNKKANLKKSKFSSDNNEKAPNIDNTIDHHEGSSENKLETFEEVPVNKKEKIKKSEQMKKKLETTKRPQIQILKNELIKQGASIDKIESKEKVKESKNKKAKKRAPEKEDVDQVVVKKKKVKKSTEEDNEPSPDIQEKISKKKKKISNENEAIEKDAVEASDDPEKPAEDDRKNAEETNDDLDDLDLVDERTIFVGNWPMNKLKKHLKGIFKKYGSIESVRFRSVPLKDPRISKRVSAITKQFHPDRTSVNAYVKFTDVESANKALAENGTLYSDHHLRVTLSNTCKVSQGHSIFIGNLHFNTEDEELWRVFSVCGEIESVRILRDANTGMSRGCAYVNFKSDDGVELAMQMPETKINERVIRIKRPETKTNKSKTKSENFLNKFNKQIIKNIPKAKKEGFQGFKGAKKTKKNFKRTKRPRPSFQAKSKNKFNKKDNVPK